jgi:membrane protein implicated in regulation of membrane protease activity
MEIVLRVLLWVGAVILVGNAVLMTWLLWRYRQERRQRSADDESSRAGQYWPDEIAWLELHLHDQ